MAFELQAFLYTISPMRAPIDRRTAGAVTHYAWKAAYLRGISVGQLNVRFSDSY